MYSVVNIPKLSNSKETYKLQKTIERVHNKNKNADEVKRYSVRVLTDVFGKVI